MGSYRVLSTIARGTHGVVLKAEDTETGDIVALKKPVYDLHEVPLTVVREIKLLKEIQHENVVRLLDVIVESGQVVVAYEHLALGSLAGLIANPDIVIDVAVCKGFARMILTGVRALHENFVVHRDVKPDNLLVGDDGVVKVADLGLSKPFCQSDADWDTPEVVTFPYRAPELFFGAYAYSPAIDCWSVGCVVAELWNRVPLFPHDSELSALQAMAALFDLSWPGADLLPRYLSFKPDTHTKLPLSAYLPAAPASLVTLVESLLTPQPSKRPTADLALAAPFFSEAPDEERVKVHRLAR
ncbi:Cyclin-dependent kinase 7 [Diplonema papillatum]|nr:Cyclin-dependent kinase 7 [Diplonema papillatum]